MAPRNHRNKPNGNLKKVEFHFETTPGLRVCLAGSFSNWDPYLHQMQEASVGGLYRLFLHLPPGKHEYRFVIGEEWRIDPQNPDTVSNAYGSTNSVVIVE